MRERGGWVERWSRLWAHRCSEALRTKLGGRPEGGGPVVLVGSGRDENVFVSSICARLDLLGEQLAGLHRREVMKEVWKGASPKSQVLEGMLEALQLLVGREGKGNLGEIYDEVMERRAVAVLAVGVGGFKELVVEKSEDGETDCLGVYEAGEVKRRETWEEDFLRRCQV